MENSEKHLSAVQDSIYMAHLTLLEVLDYLRIHGPSVPSQIARHIGVLEKDVYLPISELLARRLTDILALEDFRVDRTSRKEHSLDIPQFNVRGDYSLEAYSRLIEGIPTYLEKTRGWHEFFKSVRAGWDNLFLISLTEKGDSYLHKDPYFRDAYGKHQRRLKFAP